MGLEGALGNDWRGKIGEIRRAYFEQHRSIKEIVRTLSVSRDGAQGSLGVFVLCTSRVWNRGHVE